MYSLVLMMAMTANEVPHGIFFDASGCSGARLALTRKHRLEEWLKNRRKPLQEESGMFGLRVAASSGCSGFRTVGAGCSGFKTVAAGTGCNGIPAGFTLARRSNGTYMLIPNGPATGFTPMPDSGAGGGAMEGIFGRRIERIAVHRQLHKALRSNTLTDEQKAIAQQALDDPGVYEAAVSKAHKMLAGQKPPVGFDGRVGKLGDGTVLQMLLANLPAIIAAIEQILKLFGAFNDLIPLDHWATIVPSTYESPPLIVHDSWSLAA